MLKISLRHTTYSLTAAILTGLAAVSCSSTDIDLQLPDMPEHPYEGQNVPITLTLNATALGNSSRAIYPEHRAEANELINDWRVAFVDNITRQIVRVEAGNPTGVWNDVVSTILPAGRTYTAYAFANFEDLDGLLDDLGLKEGATLAEGYDDTIQNYVYENTTSVFAADTQVPMSGSLVITPKGTVNETFAIKVVRLLSRVEFAFVRETSSEATEVRVRDITLKPVNVAHTYLMPSDILRLPQSARYDSISVRNYLYGGNFDLEVPINSDGDVAARTRFYIKESVAPGNHPTDHFHIGLKLDRIINGETLQETATYALAADTLKDFKRNDYVLFPIVISDYTPELDVFDFPPIGGYPVQVKSNGTEFYATFSSSGAFDILARLRDSRGNTKVVKPYSNDNTKEYVEITNVENAPKGFELTFDKTENMWQADFNQGTMREPIKITFEFHIQNLVYTRTLYLLSK